jgi:hypothetical protein
MVGSRLRTAVPETLRDGRRSKGLRDTWIAIRQTRPDDRKGRRATVSLVAGRWSRSMAVAIRSRSMGSDAREGMGSARIRCCRGIGWGAWTARLCLGHPDHEDVGIRPTLSGVAWMTSLCIRDADLILQEVLTRR